MPPSTGKRSARGIKREAAASVANDSHTASPARASKRKRVTEPQHEAETEQPARHTSKALEQSDLDLTKDELADIVASHLAMPENEEVQAALDFNNECVRQGGENVQAFAKIQGRDWTFYVKRTRINIGRPPEATSEATGMAGQVSGGVDLMSGPLEENKVHVDIGPSKLVSRLHAEVYFGQNGEEAWFILVNGRNGIKLNERLIRRGQCARLHNGSVIEVAGVEMMFVLPDQNIVIAPTYLRRANLIENDLSAPTEQPEYDTIQSSAQRGVEKQPRLPGQPLIAPAVPDFSKRETPMKRQHTGPPAQSPRTVDGAINIDYSLEQNKDIKPDFTYSQLISQAILAKPKRKATLAQIYEYIMANYSFYNKDGSINKGWQNSIRHNLSLNTGFYLSPRETHEPGKGGYWIFKPEKEEELITDAWGAKTKRSPNKRGQSSVPGSPAVRRSAAGAGDTEAGSQLRKVEGSPQRSISPGLAPYEPTVQQFTPDHGRYDMTARERTSGNGSPVPRSRRTVNSVFGISDHFQGSPPVLSSSYAAEDGLPLATTPAPQRMPPGLAPPSTAQRPSQHMPTSSPAPFWRFLDLNTGTPMRPFESPIKDGRRTVLQSSSPPRVDTNGSPTRNGASEAKPEATTSEAQEEEPVFDLSKRFMSISKYHVMNNGLPTPAAANGQA